MSAGSAARREDVGLERAKKRGGGVVLAALRQHRLRRGLTQEELAQKAGVTQNYLTKVERASEDATLLWRRSWPRYSG